MTAAARWMAARKLRAVLSKAAKKLDEPIVLGARVLRTTSRLRWWDAVSSMVGLSPSPDAALHHRGTGTLLIAG